MISINNTLRLMLIVYLFGCGNQDKRYLASSTSVSELDENSIEKENEKEVRSAVSVGTIPLPSDYERIEEAEGSFGAYLRSIQIKVDDNVVNLYDGRAKSYQGAHYCILDVDVGKRDLQQCADAVMRMRAEYFYHHQAFDSIAFNFTSGEKVPFTKYANGYRPHVEGNKVSWSLIAGRDYGYDNFRKYLNLIYIYAGSYSLEKELKPKNVSAGIMPGDVIIQGGFPGHAVLVMDVAVHRSTKERIFLMAQSYMPAQEIHILTNQHDTMKSPWYTSEFGPKLYTPEWTFNRTDIKSW